MILFSATTAEGGDVWTVRIGVGLLLAPIQGGLFLALNGTKKVLTWAFLGAKMGYVYHFSNSS